MFLLTTHPYLKLKFFLFPLFTLLRESNKYLRLLDYIRSLTFFHSALLGFFIMSHSDDDFSLGVSFSIIPNSFSNLT